MRIVLNCMLTLSAFTLLSTSAWATLIYSHDFESPVGHEWSTSRTSYDDDTTTFLGRFGNETATLSLADIGAHSNITVSFDLILWDSWDGENTRWGKDYQGLKADNSLVYEYTFARPNANTSSTNPDTTPDLVGKFGMTSWWEDALYKNFNNGFTFDHTGSGLTLSFYGRHLQPLGDESWGIDNIIVYTDNDATPVPEPATILLFGCGLVGLAGVVKKSKL